MEVAIEMGISQAQVSRLEKSAMKKIKGKWNYRTYVRLRKSDNFLKIKLFAIPCPDGDHDVHELRCLSDDLFLLEC